MTRSSRLAVLGLAALGALSTTFVVAPGRAATASSGSSSLALESEFVLLPERPDSLPAVDPRSLTVLFDGRPQEVLSVAPARIWRFVVYVDPALATPDGVIGGAAALSEAAESLASVGTVEVVVADPFVETYLEATRDAEEIREALLEVEDLADAAGEILALRDELVAAEPETLDSPSTLLAFQEESELLHESRLELLRWLAIQKAEGPTCLILLQDGYDLGAAFSEQLQLTDRDALASQLAQSTQAHTRLAATLAAAGWTVMPFALEQAASELLPGRAETLRILAESTGGAMVTEAARLTDLLRALAQAVVVQTRITSLPDGSPRALEMRLPDGRGGFSAARWASVGTPIGLSDIRALQTLEEAELLVGPLRTTGLIHPDREAPAQADGFVGILEAITNLEKLSRSDPWFRVSLLLIQTDGPPQTAHDLVAPGELAAAEAWLYRHRLLVTENLAAGAVVVEELRTGLWGSSPLELSEEGIPTLGRKVAIWESTSTPRQPSPGRGALSEGRQEQAVIRVLPPKRRPVVGKVRFQTLVSSPIIASVAFLFDDREVDRDDRAPFSTTIDVGPEPEMHRVGVVAYAANGARLGSHEIFINPRDDSFQVRIAEIASPLGGIQNIAAEVRVPTDSQLDRVEFFWNETLVETLRSAPWEIELPTPDPGAQAFVRVAAYLTDGTWIDDARLLGDAAASERVEVNLVELHVVVTDRDDKPVDGLTSDHFTVRLGRQVQEIQRLGFAEDVPLTLGVVIDTSESMYPLMVDTQKAGAQFVANTLTDGDAAFLVDFDTQPRLAQDTTTDLMTLLRTFSRFQPDGATAMYDAIIFSMLQFEERQGRKALVVLTDGDDYKSRYGPRRCIQYGKRLGVPVYIISLAGIHNARRNLRRIDLEGITEGTGGQVFYIRELGELSQAYDRINRELRSQYILTFATDRELSELELEDIEVEVEGKGLSVRGVVGNQQVQ